MSPENASIFLVEDDKAKAAKIKQKAEAVGHSVLKMVYNRRDAINYARTLEPGKFNVALIDTNLGGSYSAGQDGQDVLETIRRQDPKVKIIGISHMDRLEGADVPIVNDHDKLPEIIDKL